MSLPRELLRRAAQNRAALPAEPEPLAARRSPAPSAAGQTPRVHYLAPHASGPTPAFAAAQPPVPGAQVPAWQTVEATPGEAAPEPAPSPRPPLQPHHAAYSALMRSHDRMRTNHLRARIPGAGA